MPLITDHEPGHHNSDLDKTRTRLTEGGSWKRQRIVMAMPSANLMHAKVALSLMNLAFPPNQGVYRHLILGEEVGKAYSDSVQEVLSNPSLKEFDHWLTCEHDNLPPYDGVLKLLADMDKYPEYGAIGGLYFTKGEGGVAQIWGDPKDPVINYRPQVPIPNTVQECVGTAMGFTMYRMSMLKDLAEKEGHPLFRTVANGTQDLQFWNMARKHGYRCAIDTSILVGHIDPQSGFVW
jgi:hypothetical protein